MKFDEATIASIRQEAKSLGVEWQALAAIVEVESAGKTGATVNGRFEPLIRFEGHYFDRRLKGGQKTRARNAGLANPSAGKVKNPRSQARRWKMLEQAAKINRKAAYESVSFGVGQVMGAHWQWLGYSSVDALVEEARSSVGGQVALMARFIKKSGLAPKLRRCDWPGFARGYNGPAYRKNRYDEKMAQAYARFKGGQLKPNKETQSSVETRQIQTLLVHSGFNVQIDGIAGPKTTAAIKKFQRSRNLVADGIAGPDTMAELHKKDAPKKPSQTPANSTPPSQKRGKAAPAAVVAVTGLAALYAAFSETVNGWWEAFTTTIGF